MAPPGAWAAVTACVGLVALCCHPGAALAAAQLRPARFIQFGTPAASHWMQHGAIARELADRGHQVLVLGSSEEGATFEREGLAGRPNVRVETYAAPFPELRVREAVARARLTPGLQGITAAHTTVQDYTNVVLHDDALLGRLRAFAADLVITDPAIAASLALADALGLPKAMVGVAGLLPPFDAHSYGFQHASLASVPTVNSGLPATMSLWQRARNAFNAALALWFSTSVLEPLNDRSWTQTGIPPHSGLASSRQVRLVLATDDFAVTPARPLSPHVVLVGALTARPAQPLPPDLEEFLAAAGAAGVVYASFGTTAIAEPAEMRAVAAALGALAPARALWRLAPADQAALAAAEVVPANNTRVAAWLPQNDLLGDARLRAFLTQGGTNSFLEAAYHGVPIVGLPLFAEQPHNVAQAVHQGWGVMVNIADQANLAANLDAALRAVVTNSSYRAAAARVSCRMRAQRRTPAEKAADALEHVAWTGGDDYLHARSHLAWWQEALLDVAALASLAAALALWLLYRAGRALLGLVRRGDKRKRA